MADTAWVPRGTVEGLTPDIAPPRPRDARLDALRGLAIVLVVLGHSLVRATPPAMAPGVARVAVPGVGYVLKATLMNPLLNVIYSFHIPLFAFVSGMVIFGSRTGFGLTHLKRRFMALMVPYWSWLFLSWVTSGERSLGGLFRYMAAGTVDPHSPGSLWFLYALFLASVVLVAVKRVSQSDGALVLSALLVGLAGVVPVGQYNNLFGLSDVAWVYPFFAFGLVFAGRREVADRFRWGAPLALMVWLGLIPFVAPTLVPGPRWWFAPLAAIAGVAGIPGAGLVARGLWAVARVVCALAGIMTVYFAYAHVRSWPLKAQAWVGQRSVGVYAVHGTFLFAWGVPFGVTRVVALAFTALAGSLAATVILERFKWTRILLLGRAR